YGARQVISPAPTRRSSDLVHRRFAPAVAQPERGEVTSVQIAPHDQFVAVRVGQPAVLAAEVVLVGEEVRRRLVRLRFADQVLPGPLPLALGVGPVFDADAAAVARVEVRRDVTRGEDTR